MAKIEKVFTIKINGLEQVVTAKDALILLAEEQKRLSNELKQLPADSEGYATLASSLESVTTQISELSSVVEQGANSFQTFDSALNETATESDNTANSINGLKSELEGIEESLGNLDVGSDEFQKLAVRGKQIEKTLESVQLQAESVALGFVGIGKAGNTVEGLSVQIAALNAKLATLSDPLERAEVDKQIEQIKIAIVEAEAEAKKGIFPEGSIGRLEAEFEALSLQIRNVPAGSAQYKQLQAALDQTRAKADFLNLSVTEQKQIFRDLGTSIGGAFASGAGLLASFAGDSEDAQKSILILNQALAATEFINQLAETARQAREAKKVAGLALETTLQKGANAALAENVALQNKGAVATDLAGKSAKGAGGAFQLLNAIIRAIPIGAIITAIGLLGAAIFALSSKFKPFAAIVNGVKDAFGGVIQVGKDVIENGDKVVEVFVNIGSAIVDILNPISQAKRALNLFGGDFKVDSILDNLKKVGKAGEKLGEGFADSFEKGVKRTQQLRALDAKEALNSATDINAQLEEAALGSSRSTSDARRAIRTRELKEDRALALERLKLENDLTDAEVAILQSGNAEKIASLKKVTNARGEVNKEILELVGKVTESDKALTDERQAAFQEYIQDRIKAVSDTLAFELAKLGELNNFEKQRVALSKDINAQLATLELQRQAGEFKSFAEYQQLKDTIIQDGANQSKQIAKQEAEFNLSIRNQDRDAEINAIQDRLDTRRSLNETTFAEEKATLERLAKIRQDALTDEVQTKGLDPAIPEQATRLKEIDEERLQINRELNKELATRQSDFINQEAEAAIKSLDFLKQTIELEKERKDLQGQVDTSGYEKQLEAINKVQSESINLNKRAQSLKDEQALITGEYDKQVAKLKENYNTQLQLIQIERDKIKVEEEANQKLLDGTLIGQKKFDEAQKQIELRKKQLENQEIKLKVELDVETDKSKQQLDKAIQDISDKALADFKTYMSDPLGTEIGSALSKAFGDKNAGIIKEQLTKLGTAASDLVGSIFSNLTAGVDAKLTEIQERQAKLDEQLAATNEEIGATEERLTNLYGALAEARDADKAAVAAQIDQQITKQKELQTTVVTVENAKKTAAKETIALEQEKKDIAIKQAVLTKTTSIAEAAINTYLGVTKSIATVPFPANFVVAGLVGAIGAAQIASILATPLPTAKEGGYLGEDGGLIKLATGGILQGNSHDSGGIRGTGRFNNVEVEGGEAIISKRVVNQHPTLVKSLVQKGSNPNTPIPSYKFATGGMLPNTGDTRASSDDIIKAINQIEIRPTVAITDINEGQNRVSVIERSSKL